MTEFSTLDDLEEDLGDFEGPGSANSENDKVDSILIKKILFEMKSEFNKASGQEAKSDGSKSEEEDVESKEDEDKEEGKEESKEDGKEEESKEEERKEIEKEVEEQEKPEEEEKPEEKTSDEEKAQEIDVHSLNETDSSQTPSNFSTPRLEEEPPKKKRVRRSRQTVDMCLITSDEPLEKRTRRQSRFLEGYDQDLGYKRSSRRTSKDFSRESVLQNAIARKEKSFSSLHPPDEKPQRRSSRLNDDLRPQRKLKTRSQDAEPSGDAPEDPAEDKTSRSKSAPKLKDNSENEPISSNLEDFTEETDCKPKQDSDSGDGVSVKHFHPLSVYTGLCECESLTAMRPSRGSVKASDMCRAVDSFDDKFYICCNPISEETVLLRASKKTPYLQFCSAHVQRLFGHNACPACGTFCTQGVFNVCVNKHIFHNDCVISKEVFSSCPHCASDNFALFRLKMENHKYPLFLPIQKPINRERMAKISLQYGGKTLQPISKEERIIKDECLVLPNGRIISAESIPLPEKEQLITLFKQPTTHTDIRFTYRNLYQAAKVGDVEKVLAIIGSGMNPNREAGCFGSLHAAASGGFLTAVHVLVQAGTNLDTLDKSQITPLMAATLNGHNHIVKYLVKSGASLTTQGGDGMTALHFAAKSGNLEACHFMLSSVNTPDSLVNIVDDGRWTALVWAAENRHSKIVRYLLEKRADPHVRDAEMNIALHWSSYSGSMEITEDLLNYGCNINLSNAHGDTPLHIAARQGADDCVTLLLARGARSDMMNKAGLTAKDCVINPDSYCLAAIELNGKINNIRLRLNNFPKILSNDVSRGRENYPIQCVNPVDNEAMPTNFTYITENCFTSNITIDRTVTSLDPCKCDDMCYTSGCMCGKISRKCWYDNKGKLSGEFNFEDPPMLFECSEACNCNILTCKNRVVQKGIKAKLQMVKTKDKSWAVITLAPIMKGSYVCEYVGEIISDCEADTREDDSYLFDLDNRDGGESYCLDARKYGNISRFINHSCLPNLSPVRVFIGHRDLHFPRIAMFATRDIQPYEELGYDYGEKFWVVKGKTFTCKCNEEVCKYSEETIQQTLERYSERMEMEESAA